MRDSCPAGEDGESIRPTVNRLKAANIGSILDYAAEADVGDSKRKDIDVNRNVLQSRTYDYSGEEECDKNAEISLKAIQAATESKGFAAVKVRSSMFHTDINVVLRSFTCPCAACVVSV